MTQTNNKSKAIKKSKKAPKSKFLLIFVCIFLAIVLIFTIVFATISSSREKGSVAYYKSAAMDRETANYFVTKYKYIYMGELTRSGVKNVSDTKFFWNSVAEDGKSYGENLVENTREFIKQILVTNYLFDKYATLTTAERNKITRAVEETITYQAGGNGNTFEEEVRKYGFSYDSYKTAAVMLYKAQMAQSIVCGVDGAALKDEDELVSEYLSEYSHVKLLFIRTETTFELDDEGNRKKDDNGNYIVKELTSEKKAERETLIANLKGYIDASGAEAAMNPTMFNSYLEEYDEGDLETHTYGYYLHSASAFSIVFAEKYPSLAEKIFEMEKVSGTEAKFGYAEVDTGICFVYKYAVSPADIEESSLSECFADFYTNLSSVFFERQVKALTTSVKIKSKFSEIDIVGLPYNPNYLPNF